jgi:Ankyrin repeats (3 copies)
VVERLLQAGAEVNLTGSYSCAPLSQAAANGDMEILNFLLDAGADVNRVEAGIALFAADAWAGNIEAVRRWPHAGANDSLIRECIISTIQRAADMDRMGLAHVFLDNVSNFNINFNPKNYFGLTAMGLASAYGHIAVIELLLQAGADPNARALISCPPLVIAAREGLIDIVDCLLGAGADPDLRPGYEHKARSEWDDAWDDKPVYEFESAFEAALKGPRSRSESWRKAVAGRTRIAGRHDILERLIVAAPMRKDAKRSASERRSGKRPESRTERRASCGNIVIPAGAFTAVSWHVRADSQQSS